MQESDNHRASEEFPSCPYGGNFRGADLLDAVHDERPVEHERSFRGRAAEGNTSSLPSPAFARRRRSSEPSNTAAVP
jgi:hypothetical protein